MNIYRIGDDEDLYHRDQYWIVADDAGEAVNYYSKVCGWVQGHKDCQGETEPMDLTLSREIPQYPISLRTLSGRVVEGTFEQFMTEAVAHGETPPFLLHYAPSQQMYRVGWDGLDYLIIASNMVEAVDHYYSVLDDKQVEELEAEFYGDSERDYYELLASEFHPECVISDDSGRQMSVKDIVSCKVFAGEQFPQFFWKRDLALYQPTPISKIFFDTFSDPTVKETTLRNYFTYE